MNLRNALLYTAAAVAFAGSASAAQASTVSATFTKGAIAEYTNGANQTSNARLFSQLGIQSIMISQASTTWGGTQGNDTTVNVTLTKTNGQVETFTAAINWLQKTGNTADWIGLTISPTTSVNDGFTLSAGSQKTYLLEFSHSSLVETMYASDPNSLDGSSDTRGAISALNALVPLDTTAPVITGPTGGAGAANSAVSVNENQTGATRLTANEPVTWSIVGGTDAGKFSIAPDGTITFNTAPDYEAPTDSNTNNTYVVTVQATDASGNVSTQTVTVTVLNLNDTTPVFINTNATSGGSASYSFNYAENSATTTTLGTVTAAGGTGALTYSITAGDPNNWYQINPTTGAITLTTAGAASLANDYEQTPNAQTLTVQVSDGTASTTIQVALNETDVNENPPAITGPSGGSGAAASALTVNENQTAVTQMTADKPVTWSISGGTEASKFSIAPNGIITFNTAPNYEAPTDGDTNNTYVLVVQAVDSSGAITTQTVTVTVANIDDTAPAITGPNGGPGAAASALTVNENQTAVTRLVANEGVTWSITGGTDAAKFSIAADGTITFNTAPDYEAPTDSDGNNTYVLTVQAVDAAGNISTQTITVTVANLDDTAPVITGPSGGAGAAASTIGVYEDQTAVTRVTANETVTWSIVGGADAAQFTIAADGTITFRTAPDFENPADADHNNAYLVQVQARDAAGNVSTQTITVNVLNLDEITQKLNAISSALRSNLRNYAFGSLQDMLSFNEGLMQNTADGDCNANARNKGVHGSVRANQSGENVDLKLSRQVNACATRVRIYFDMGLAASSMAGNANLRALGSVRAETLVAKDVTVGLGLMGSFASDNLTSFANSSISDESLQGNLYVRARLSDTLRAGAFGSIGKAWYRFGLHDDGFNLAGRMTGDRYAYGAMLSGDMTLAGIKVTTDVALSRAVEKLGSASLAANYKGESRSGIGFAVGTVDATRLSVPAHLRLISRGDEKADSHSLVLTFSPGLLCEDKSADASGLSCGYQLGGKLSLATSSRDRAYLDARHEDVSGNTREVFSLGYAHRWGPVELGVSVDQDVSAMRGDSRAMMRLRFVGR